MLVTATAPDRPESASEIRLQSSSRIHPAEGSEAKPQLRPEAAAPAANPRPDPRTLALEELILGLAENRTLDELRFQILALYPELAPDFQPEPAQNRSNRIRAAARRYWLRQEITDVVISDYKERMIADQGSD
jgi:hypothetical protein